MKQHPSRVRISILDVVAITSTDVLRLLKGRLGGSWSARASETFDFVGQHVVTIVDMARATNCDWHRQTRMLLPVLASRVDVCDLEAQTKRASHL